MIIDYDYGCLSNGMSTRQVTRDWHSGKEIALVFSNWPAGLPAINT